MNVESALGTKCGTENMTETNTTGTLVENMNRS